MAKRAVNVEQVAPGVLLFKLSHREGILDAVAGYLKGRSSRKRKNRGKK